MSQISRKYKLTVILDTRGYDAPVESLQEKFTGMLKELGGEVTAMENIGRQEFVRVTEKGHTGDTYLLVEASGPAQFPGDLQERIRLDKQIKRVLIQSA
jgi:small subunit ribosomal protein S6